MSCEKNASSAGNASRANGIPKILSKGAYYNGLTKLRLPPAVEVEASTRKYGRFTLTPLSSGYGITLGNALRRTLISSLPGAAVTSVRVEGVDHEFSTIPDVREDMTALILNLKGVRFKFKEDKPARIKLKARGEGEVKAGDLELPDHVEVVNPDHLILTGDSEKTKVDLEMNAETGYGYSPSEDRQGLPIGEIAIDAVFSPVRMANYKTTPAGVAEAASFGRPFEKATIEVKTDGTITPEDALREASARLGKHFDIVADEPWGTQKKGPRLPYHRKLDDIGLQPRTQNALQKAGLRNVGEVMKLLRQGSRGTRQIEGMGEKSFTDLMSQLESLNLSDGDKEVLSIVKRRPRKAEAVLQRAVDAGGFRKLEWEIDDGIAYIHNIEAAEQGQGAGRQLLQQLKEAGFEAAPDHPRQAALPFWRKMYTESLIADDPDSLETWEEAMADLEGEQ